MSNLISVLVIEDEPGVFNLIKETLTKNKPPYWPLKYRVINTRSLEGAIKSLTSVRWDIVLLDLGLPVSEGASVFSEGISTFWKCHEVSKAPIIVFTGADPNGIFEEMLTAGAYRVFSKADFAPCLPLLHYSIRHVLYEAAQKRLIEQQDQTISGKLRPLITACAGCGRMRDEVDNRYMSISAYFKRRGVVLSHGHCPDCYHDYYEKDVREATADFK